MTDETTDQRSAIALSSEVKVEGKHKCAVRVILSLLLKNKKIRCSAWCTCLNE